MMKESSDFRSSYIGSKMNWIGSQK